MKKGELPSDMAFPVSVSALRDKLVCVSQHSEITVDYSYYKGMSPRRLQKTKFGRSHKVIAEKSREIMTASYERSEIRLTTPNSWLREDSSMNKYTKHRWGIRLRAIPLVDLADARALLDSEGYAKLVDWFKDTNKYAGSIGHHSLVISFDGKQLTYRHFDSF